MKLSQKGFTVIEGLLIIAALAIIGFTGYRVYTANQDATDILNKSDDVADQEIVGDDSNQQNVSNEYQGEGKIRGSIIYPSDHIPENVEVCAVNVESELETCTKERIDSDEFVHGIGFELSVQAGNYKLLARHIDKANEYDDDAYYDKYIKQTVLEQKESDPCGDESLIDPIIISVKKDQVVQNTVAGDWAYPFALVNCNLND